MDQCFRNRNLVMVISDFLTFTDTFRLSMVNSQLKTLLRKDEIWWPLYFREYPYRVVDRKAGGALQAFLYCHKHASDLENFQTSKKLTIGILGNLKGMKIPDYMALRRLDFYEMFSKPIIRKGVAIEITALSLPGCQDLEYDKEYIQCFLLLVNSVESSDLEVFRSWLEAFYEQQCTNFFLLFNHRDSSAVNPLSLPEVTALRALVPVVCIEELTEASINAVLSNILRVVRRKEKGKLQEALRPERVEEAKPSVRRFCRLL